MRVAVVTGASSGIGREFVRQLEYFYKDLDEIWVIARREERLEQLRKEVNVPLRIFAGDLQKKHVYRQFYTDFNKFFKIFSKKAELFRKLPKKENGFIRI